MFKMSTHVFALLAIVAVLTFGGVSTAENRTPTDIPCATDGDCHVESSSSNGGNITAVCVENTCEFAVHVAPPSLSVVTRIGGRCKVSEECNIDHAECGEFHICTCVNQTVASFNHKHCLTEARQIGDECSEDMQCNFPQTTCKAGACVCDPGFGVEPDNHTLCRELNGIGASCTNEDECEVEHTKCESGSCACTVGYSAHQRECYEVSASYLSKCDMDFQCQKALGADAICIKNVCHCQRKFVFSLLQNRCVKPEYKTISNHGAGFQQELHLLPLAVFGFYFGFTHLT